jgi:hypothetical protein
VVEGRDVVRPAACEMAVSQISGMPLDECTPSKRRAVPLENPCKFNEVEYNRRIVEP